ncbi:MAG TPA: DegQ family serine endoprotease [Gammaproteobacteria bacterium]|nr:DegQ family serine endoprotease [Gammaproteobacteria bacterium]
MNSNKLFPVLGLCLLIFSSQALAVLPVAVDGQGLPSLAPMLDQTTPGVVNIAARGRVAVQNNPLLEDPFFRRFFDMPQAPRERMTQSLGSGVIVDAKKGYVLTNHHVVASADEISVTLRDGRQLDAKLVGSDPDADIAVLKIPAENLVAVPWGDSDKLRVGDFVVAIGNPFGLGQTVTSGIVSALGRSGLGIEAYEDFIQTDASINPGNSGGALVDLAGRLIGVNTAIVGPSGGNIGIGFAIPVRMAKSIMEQLIEHGQVTRGSLGVMVQDLSPELSQAFGLKGRTGAVISRVEPGSPADKSGLKAGDVVTAVNGRPVHNSGDMRNVIGLQRIGEVVAMEVLRDGKPLQLRAVIEKTKIKTVDGGELHPRLQGAKLASAAQVLNRELPGLVVVEVAHGSRAEQAGLMKEDIIVSINRHVITTPEEAAEVVKRSGGGQLLVNVQRGDAALFMVLQ